MNKINYLIVAILLLICSCSYYKNVRLLTGGSLRRKDFVQEIPFKYRKGIIVIEAKINGDTTSREFIFDTGAFNSKIVKELANSLGLATVTTKENSTAQGNICTIEVARIDSIRLGETTFYNIGAGKLEYAQGSASPCIARDGLIGANLIKLAHWQIDYARQVIRFSDKPIHIPEDMPHFTLPFSRPVFSATPKVNLMVEGATVKGLLFDVGYNGGLILPAALSNRFPSTKESMLLDQSTSGIYGTNVDTLLERTLTIALDAAAYQIPVTFSSLGKGLIGNDFLEHFIVTINNTAHEITLMQQEEVVVEGGSPFIPGVLNDTLWVINRISESHQMLKLGDTLKAVNGYQPQDLFKDHCEYIIGVRQILNHQQVEVITLNDDRIRLK